MLFRSYAWKGIAMKKITGTVLMLCVVLTAAGCNGNTDKTDEITASQTTSPSISEETTVTETATVQIKQKTENTAETEIAPSEVKKHILKLDRKELYDYEWSEEYGMALAELECSVIHLGDEDAKRYPELADALSAAADFYEVNMLEGFDMDKELAKELISSGAEGFNTLVSTLDTHIRRADDVVLSILYDSYYYNGMNDGNRSFWGGNYDAETGKELYLPDVVTDIDEFAKVVEAELFSTVGADIFYSDTIVEEYFKEYGADGTHWTLEYNGVTVYFGEGEIAGSGFGAINLTIEFAEYPELFNDKYTAVPEAYIVGLPMKSNFYTDLDGDGNGDEISVVDSYDEENDYYATLYIYVPEVYYAESFWAYDCLPYYVKTADSKNYLYVFTELETQMYLYVYEITDTTVTKVGEANVSPFYNNGISTILTDPNSMYFDIFSDEAGGGISEGNNIFSVGVDGMPAQG